MVRSRFSALQVSAKVLNRHCCEDPARRAGRSETEASSSRLEGSWSRGRVVLVSRASGKMASRGLWRLLLLALLAVLVISAAVGENRVVNAGVVENQNA